MLKAKFVLHIASAFLLYRLIRKYLLNHTVKYTYDKSSSKIAPIVRKLLCDKRFQSYKPPSWLIGSLLQSASGNLLEIPHLKYEREIITLEKMNKPLDAVCCPEVIPEGKVSLDWLHVDNDGAPIALLVPGLTGDSSQGYVARAAKVLNSRGFRVASYNPRGRGGVGVISPFIYSVGYTEDLRRVVQLVQRRFPNVDLFAAGYSLGSNYLAKFLGEEGDTSPIKAAVCLACPTDCLSCSHHLTNSFIGKILDPILVKNCHIMRMELGNILDEHPEIDLDAVRNAKTMHEFDNTAIAPMFGFQCASDYYRFSSAGLYLSRIKVPTMFIYAENDPIIPGNIIKMDNFLQSDSLISCMTAQGGHSMDWPVSLDGRTTSWSACLLASYFESVTSLTMNGN